LNGSRDPVGENLQSLIDAYRRAGLKTTVKIYPNARHETLKEINRDQVTADLISWNERGRGS
jgi:alpha-beta hydrolase superfamily lysophospholipase